MKSIPFRIFLFAKDYRPIDDVGVAKGTGFQEIRPWAGFKIGDFAKEKLGRLSFFFFSFFLSSGGGWGKIKL